MIIRKEGDRVERPNPELKREGGVLIHWWGERWETTKEMGDACKQKPRALYLQQSWQIVSLKAMLFSDKLIISCFPVSIVKKNKD